jgi:hypothetical protein
LIESFIVVFPRAIEASCPGNRTVDYDPHNTFYGDGGYGGGYYGHPWAAGAAGLAAGAAIGAAAADNANTYPYPYCGYPPYPPCN